MTTGLLLIDDHPLFRKGLRMMLDGCDDFTVLGEAAAGRQGVEMARTLQPGLILLDLHMPGLGGMQVLDEVRQIGLDARVIVLTASLVRDELVEALRLGANGYLLKETEPDELVGYVRRCNGGNVVLTDEMIRLLAQDDGKAAGAAPEPDVLLSAREAQTLGLIAQGMSNKQIARELGISDGTVKIYVKNLLRKLRLRSRLELAAWAYRTAGGVPVQAYRPAGAWR
ncbi:MULTISPECIES: response regulator [Cupriavidus]|uniref:Response regulator n=1 Tax=Cupriavidus metallidurans TaxID=119219 RepID=A0A482J357_9BURK|nr:MULTISPECIES: response regulator [Cupriavidus]MWL91944.1 response regulator [Cupriavidus sp. SW-Y-13]QBP14546.1 response regulator [Cupriavidus metallidurans]